MLRIKDVEELREHLERAQNPIFFYDNDADGFCSFVLLRRYLGRGKGVAVRTHPDIDVRYAQKVQELKGDYVFVLDRPFLGEAFVQELTLAQIPLVWIDHHEVPLPTLPENVHTYNPTRYTGKERSEEPVTALVYGITRREEDLWIAIMGCISDHYFPSFAKQFGDRYPELWGNVNEPFDAYYQTEIGRLARAIGFGLKDSITHVVGLQQFFITCMSPHEALTELGTNSHFGKKYRELRDRQAELVSRAKDVSGGKLVFFTYGGGTSISSDVANELSHLYPKKYIVVAYSNGIVSNLSIRGRRAREITEQLLPKFERASGGGHPQAVGVRLQTADLERFRGLFEEHI